MRRLQATSFESAVLERFLSDKYAVRRYDESVRKLARRFNDSSLETTRMARDFAAERSYEDVLDQWWALQFLQEQEEQVEANLELELDSLVPELL